MIGEGVTFISKVTGRGTANGDYGIIMYACMLCKRRKFGPNFLRLHNIHKYIIICTARARMARSVQANSETSVTSLRIVCNLQSSASA